MTHDVPIRPGDLVRVRLVCEIYPAIVLDGKDPTRIIVFLGNGLTVNVPLADLEPVPMCFQSTCVANFAEILKPKEQPDASA